MPSIARTFSLALLVAFLVTLVGFSGTALGSPVPLPLRKAYLDLVARSDTMSRTRAVSSIPTPTASKHVATDYNAGPTLHAVHKRQMDTLETYVTNMGQSSQTFQTLVSQYQPQANDANYQQQLVAALEDYRQNTNSFESMFGSLAEGKGLAEYDSKDQLETILKDFINSTKYTMNGVVTITYELPAVGPTLGPIVYDIKCIVDAILDLTENITDQLNNDLQPLVGPLEDQLVETVCATGLDFAGIVCVP